jgi:DNA-binding response OmpR family regulator
MADEPIVLVVDDEPSIREVVTIYLRRAGYRVQEAGDGETALEILATETPDLIVLDLMLPEVDGLEILRWVQSRSAASGGAGRTPIIVLTARGEERDRILGLEMGADDYVVKPFSPRELVSRAKAVLRRVGPKAAAPEPPASALGQPLTYGDMQIDPGARQVQVGEATPTLTATEFDLLWTLASHPRQVFTRDQLLDTVWGLTEYIDPSTVTVHIHRLREKIEPDPGAPQHIQTVWGVGYRFEP